MAATLAATLCSALAVLPAPASPVAPFTPTVVSDAVVVVLMMLALRRLALAPVLPALFAALTRAFPVMLSPFTLALHSRALVLLSARLGSGRRLLRRTSLGFVLSPQRSRADQRQGEDK